MSCCPHHVAHTHRQRYVMFTYVRHNTYSISVLILHSRTYKYPHLGIRILMVTRLASLDRSAGVFPHSCMIVSRAVHVNTGHPSPFTLHSNPRPQSNDHGTSTSTHILTHSHRTISYRSLAIDPTPTPDCGKSITETNQTKCSQWSVGKRHACHVTCGRRCPTLTKGKRGVATRCLSTCLPTRRGGRRGIRVKVRLVPR